MFLWLVTLISDLLKKLIGYQNSLWNISLSRLVILAALMIEISCGKNRQTHRYTEVKKTRDCRRRGYNKKDKPGRTARCSRTGESVEQRLRDGANVAKLQYVLTVRWAGDLRQLTQLRSFAVGDAVDDGAVWFQPVCNSPRPTRIDRVTVAYQDHYLNTRPSRSVSVCPYIKVM